MKPKKKSRMFTFCFSFLPGAAEMYMGFMKMGMSLMGIFFLSFMFPVLYRANDIFIGLAAVIWMYGFFHARNLAACEDEVFSQLEDRFIWDEFTGGKPVNIPRDSGRKWLAAILIILGLGILWSNLSHLVYRLIPDQLWDDLYPFINSIPQIIIAVIIIIIGFRLIAGKKEIIDERNDSNP